MIPDLRARFPSDWERGRWSAPAPPGMFSCLVMTSPPPDQARAFQINPRTIRLKTMNYHDKSCLIKFITTPPPDSTSLVSADLIKLARYHHASIDFGPPRAVSARPDVMVKHSCSISVFFVVPRCAQGFSLFTIGGSEVIKTSRSPPGRLRSAPWRRARTYYIFIYRTDLIRTELL